MSDPIPSIIRADAAYRLSDVKRLLGMGRNALRRAARSETNPLRIHRAGRCHYILGRDLIEWIDSEPLTVEMPPDKD